MIEQWILKNSDDDGIYIYISIDLVMHVMTADLLLSMITIIIYRITIDHRQWIFVSFLDLSF